MVVAVDDVFVLNQDNSTTIQSDVGTPHRIGRNITLDEGPLGQSVACNMNAQTGPSRESVPHPGESSKPTTSAFFFVVHGASGYLLHQGGWAPVLVLNI